VLSFSLCRARSAGLDPFPPFPVRELDCRDVVFF
jgi:hypothetical protein